jgi:hypothetical protein
MQLSFSLVIFAIAILLLMRKKNGTVNFTAKKLGLGLVVTLVVINVIMFIIM